MKRKLCAQTILLGCLWVILPELVLSQYLVPREDELNWLVQRSDAIVIGDVVRLESQWNENKTQIYTFVYLNISDSLKGSPNKQIAIKKLGGTVGEITMTLKPDFELQSGEKVLVFLKKFSDSDLYYVTDWKYGKFTILGRDLDNKVTGKLNKKTLLDRIRSSVKHGNYKG
jgi:hypothetical protein